MQSKFSLAGLFLASSVFSLPAFAVNLSGQVLSNDPFQEWFPVRQANFSHTPPQKAPQSTYNVLGLPYSSFLQSTQVVPKSHNGEPGILVSSPQAILHQEILILQQAGSTMELPLHPGNPQAQPSATERPDVVLPPSAVSTKPTPNIVPKVSPVTSPTLPAPALIHSPSPRQHRSVSSSSWARYSSLPAIRPGDTLWDIAVFLRQDPAVTTYQVMAAIFRENPQAFIDHNPNLLRIGATLKIPSKEQVLSQSPEAAYQFFHKLEHPTPAKATSATTPTAPEKVPTTPLAKASASTPKAQTKKANPLLQKLQEAKKAEEQASQLTARLRQTIARDRAELALSANRQKKADLEINNLEEQVTQAREKENTVQQKLAKMRARNEITKDIAEALAGGDVLLAMILLRRFSKDRKYAKGTAK